MPDWWGKISTSEGQRSSEIQKCNLDKTWSVSGYFFLWEFFLAITLDWSDIVEPGIVDASEDREELLVTDGAFRLMSSHPSMVMARRCLTLAIDLVTTCNSFG